MLNTQELLENITEFLKEKKAKQIKIIDIDKISSLTHYFVICSGTSSTHIKTLADNVEEKLEQLGIRHISKEGYGSARWILLDYGPVVVHIFHDEDREFYKLERLWSDGETKIVEN